MGGGGGGGGGARVDVNREVKFLRLFKIGIFQGGCERRIDVFVKIKFKKKKKLGGGGGRVGGGGSEWM